MAESSLPATRPSRRNLWIMACAFTVLFSAYNTLQNYATSLFPNGLGNQSLVVLYVTCSLSMPLAPAVVDALGPRLAMVAGAAMYVAYLVSLVRIVPAVVLGFSAVIGFGAAILWVGNGVYITMDAAPAEYAQYTAAFWSVFQLCNIFGNLATYLVFPHLQSTSTLYLGFAVVGAVGTGMLLLLGPPSGSGAAGGAPGAAAARRPPAPPRPQRRLADAGASVAAAARLLADWKIACILPLFLLSGYELAFWTGAFPQLLSPSVIGLVLTAAGVGEVAGAPLFGAVSDRVGRTASLALGTALFAGGVAVAGAMRAGVNVGPSVGGAPVAAFAAALAFGLGDACFNTNSYAMCSQLTGNKPAGGGAGEGDASRPGGKGAAGAAAAAAADEDVDAAVREGLLAGQAAGAARAGGLAVNSYSLASPPASRAATDDPSDADADAAAWADAAGEGGGDGGGRGGNIHGGAGGATDGSASVGGYAVFQLLQNIGSAIGFQLGLTLPLADATDGNGNVTTRGSLGQVWLLAAMLVLSLGAFAVVDAHERARARRAAA